jgi:hypothetical protein
MIEFKDIPGVRRLCPPIVGRKIHITEVLNKEVAVFHYSVHRSKFYKDGICLRIQIEFNDEKRALFVGSQGILYYLEQINQFPFKTTIIKDNKYYHFT